ncbi:IS5 family transposase [Streptomyces sp. NRRL B-3229]|uniref:IS5 family transposase n=1 Tax=Streptomyces sp. NRRL B-3229 TaxID=1463836 RepID=UPI000D141DA2|nr:IS5 family transposase [Streptomyces sp. NRRL B-3229]
MLSRGDLTDTEWAVLEPLLPVSDNRCGRWRDHRQVINGIIHRLGTGVHGRELPERFGPWKTVHKRHLLWSADGTWEMLLQHVQAAADADGDIDWNVNVDSTSVRAHQHAAGAPKRPPPTSPSSSKGGTSKISSCPRAHHLAPPGGGSGAPGEALGRSRGGLTTKVHVAAEGRCRPLTLLITPGQRADCTQFEPVMDKIRVPRMGLGRPRRTPDSVGADKAYSNRKIRTYLRKRGIQHVIPEKKDHKAARLRRGSRGGRPKQFRAVATRYDKRGYVYLGTVTAAALLIWLRS